MRLRGVLYGPDNKVLTGVGMLLKDGVSRRTHDSCQMASCITYEDLVYATQNAPIWHIACVDIEDGSGISRARDVRSLMSEAELLLLVKEGVSPMMYIRPGVMPCGVIQMPARRDLVLDVINDVAIHLVEVFEEADGSSSFALEGKEGITRIAYDRIVCFESKSKRICVRLSREQYTYYDTLDQLEQRLPSSFARCHRGYIINVNRVSRLMLADNSLHMDDGSIIPVSRSYKAKIKELLG